MSLFFLEDVLVSRDPIRERLACERDGLLAHSVSHVDAERGLPLRFEAGEVRHEWRHAGLIHP